MGATLAIFSLGCVVAGLGLVFTGVAGRLSGKLSGNLAALNSGKLSTGSGVDVVGTTALSSKLRGVTGVNLFLAALKPELSIWKLRLGDIRKGCLWGKAAMR